MSQPHVEEQLKKFVRIQLFTDALPYISDAAERERLVELNRKVQAEWFGNTTLPAYAVIPPDPNVLSNPEAILSRLIGAETQQGQFSQFLDDGLAKWQKLSAAPQTNRLVGRR